MKVCCMALDELREWVKNKPEKGDVAYCKNHHDEREYMYVYTGPDPNPTWVMQEDLVNKCLEEINKLKIEDTTVNKRCENCKHWHYGGLGANLSFCKQDDQVGILVPKFTCCDKHEPKEERSTPFDNLKFYLKNASTGELDIKYICEDCGKIEDKPFHWLLRLPMVTNGKASVKRPGYYFRCEECDKKKDGKI